MKFIKKEYGSFFFVRPDGARSASRGIRTFEYNNPFVSLESARGLLRDERKVKLYSASLFFIIASLSSCSLAAFNKKPRATVIMVVDQFAYNYLRTLSPYLKNGIKFLMQHGIVYENANYPHAMPSTGPGHTGLNCGMTPNYTGIPSNHWCDPDGNIIACDDDDPKTAAVINPNGGVYNYGKGPRNIMVDGITDQFAMSAQPSAPRAAFSVSIKSRSAICTANKMGKAIWLDEKTGSFTSSKAYYEQLPVWLTQFNKQKGLQRLSKVTWPLYFPRNSPAYNFKNIDNYTYANRPSIVGKTLPIDWAADNPLALYERTPAANQLLFDLAERCIKTHVTRTSCQELLLWVCLSPLDMIGHDYGPQSREAIDMIYHLDCQIASFMDAISCYLKRTDVLFVLTGDHGVTPIPELLYEEGYDAACRLDYSVLIPELNQAIKDEFEISDFVSNCTASQIYVKEKIFNSLSPDEQKSSLNLIKEKLGTHPGIKRIWTLEELACGCFDQDQIESFYKRQVYPGRTGKLIIQPFPYCVPDEFSKGTGHRTPYAPDTHVPLIMYQKHNLERRVMYEKVWTLQLPNSLAFILHIQQPSASTYQILPGLIDYDPITGEVIQTIAL